MDSVKIYTIEMILYKHSLDIPPEIRAKYTSDQS